MRHCALFPPIAVGTLSPARLIAFARMPATWLPPLWSAARGDPSMAAGSRKRRAPLRGANAGVSNYLCGYRGCGCCVPRDIRQPLQRAQTPREMPTKPLASGLGRSWSPYDCGSEISAVCRVCAIPLRHSCGDFRPLRPCSKTDTNPLQPHCRLSLGVWALCGGSCRCHLATTQQKVCNRSGHKCGRDCRHGTGLSWRLAFGGRFGVPIFPSVS